MRIAEEIIKLMIEQAKKKIREMPATTHCFAFEFCINPLALNYYFIRYVEADLTDPCHVKDRFGYLCFNREGQRLECEPIFEKQNEEVEFYDNFIIIQKFEKLP